ncbi:hypothetical protein B0H13DRAFT_1864374 [Mycena leptocephala]|nr:hypothetical protein B0H13DRAFT_1864374 [Mycena leptocephala]
MYFGRKIENDKACGALVHFRTCLVNLAYRSSGDYALNYFTDPVCDGELAANESAAISGTREVSRRWPVGPTRVIYYGIQGLTGEGKGKQFKECGDDSASSRSPS